MAVVHFSKYQERLLQKLKDKEAAGIFVHPKDTDLSLIDQFVMIPVQPSVGGGMTLGNSIAAIGVIGLQTGMLYYFVLKEFAPDIYNEAFGE